MPNISRELKKETGITHAIYTNKLQVNELLYQIPTVKP